LGAARADAHVLTSFARVVEGRVTYPGRPGPATQTELPLGAEPLTKQSRRRSAS
jgi:hypothetical protein